jgi:L-iditol 2-dehydrogenase/threonine 3-dehydrogenase
MYYLGEHELNVYGSMMYRKEDYQEAVAMISGGNIKTAPLITRHFPFEKYLDAYQFIEEKGPEIMKVIIDL